jgi:hypothetical protein
MNMTNKVFWIGRAKARLVTPLNVSSEEAATSYFQNFYIVAFNSDRALHIIKQVLISDSAALVTSDPPEEVEDKHIPSEIDKLPNFLEKEGILYQSGKVYFTEQCDR